MELPQNTPVATVDVAATPRPVSEPLAAFPPLPPPQRVPWDGVVARLRGSVLLRRFVPLPVAVALIRLAYGTLFALRPERLEPVRAVLAAVVGGTPAEARLEELARRHPVAMAEAQELSWRPWRLGGIPVDNPERISAARATGRGVLMSFTHHGPFHGRRSLAPWTRPAHGPTGDWLYLPPPKGYFGYWFEYCRRMTRNSGFHVLPAKGSYPVLAALLRQGRLVSIALDMPGRTPTRFLGKQVQMTSGTARLAMETGALVVPCAMVHGRRPEWRNEVGDAFDPADFASVEELHQALADWHSERILSSPEYYEDPARPGGWAVAGPDGWFAAAPPA